MEGGVDVVLANRLGMRHVTVKTRAARERIAVNSLALRKRAELLFRRGV